MDTFDAVDTPGSSWILPASAMNDCALFVGLSAAGIPKKHMLKIWPGSVHTLLSGRSTAQHVMQVYLVRLVFLKGAVLLVEFVGSEVTENADKKLMRLWLNRQSRGCDHWHHAYSAEYCQQNISGY